MRFLAAFLALLSFVVSPLAAFAEDAPLFEKPGLAELMAKSVIGRIDAKNSKQPLSIVIRPNDLAIAVFDAPSSKIVWRKAERRLLLGFQRLEYSDPVPIESDDSVGQRPFDLSDIPLDRLPEIVLAAAQAANVSDLSQMGVLIARRAHWSVPKAGPLRWLFKVRGPVAERYVLTEADGRIIGVDRGPVIDGRQTRLFEQDWPYAIAREEIAFAAPAGETIHEISISPDEATVIWDDPKKPEEPATWRWSAAGMTRSVGFASIAALRQSERARFAFKDARLDLAPAMLAEARKALKAENGRFVEMTVRRPAAGKDGIVHEVTFSYPERDKGKARFDSAGKLIATELPERLQPAESRTLAAIYENAVKDLARDFGQDVRIVELDLRDDGTAVTTIEDPRNPGQMVQLVRNHSEPFEPFGTVWPDKDLANAFQIKDFFHINGEGITNASRATLKLFEGKPAVRVERILISRATPFYKAKNNAVMFQFRTTDATGQKTGWLVLDVVEGKTVDVMAPG